MNKTTNTLRVQGGELKNITTINKPMEVTYAQ